MLDTNYTTVSDLAICQRCPVLFAYKIHRGYKSVWRVGIKGSDNYYGSIFHKFIAKKFFDAASNPNNRLHDKILISITKGSEALEEMIREDIFLPFVSDYAGKLTDAQITSMAKGVTTWVKAMHKFFREIPSLADDAKTVFIKPEGDLLGVFNYTDGDFNSRLVIKGRYDALLFNVDKKEARLFEFKGFAKSDVTVPLSQSLIYAWLLYKSSGIVPSIEIIYLDEHEQPPIIFNVRTVRNMIKAGLRELFTTALNIILLRRQPNILQDKELCKTCRFNHRCRNDIANIFKRKRKGTSLLSVLIFVAAVVMIVSQMFFFSNNTYESIKDERNLIGIKIKLASKVELAKEYIKSGTKPSSDMTETERATAISNDEFYEKTITSHDFYKDNEETIKDWTGKAVVNEIFLTVNDLNYTLSDGYKEVSSKRNFPHRKVFAAMGENYYLIRAYTKLPEETSLMYQVLVKRNGTNTPEVISHEEIWY